ncbi:ferredoxin--nitrite reductase [Sulfurimonas sp. C5]|uniref:ferredoxin--nitrite reductase n=1 Tax=Sulfurimonas sp. C5 TaxID=3036947 RepID=UPI0024579156|nr:ferredoxin--nitrite reductase [Sulfurimonas sp. C5]MDH4944173.1 ferredoxin--nitrite reductase [Sulfurimonas sp. C5]
MKKLEEVSIARNKKVNKIEKIKELKTPQEAYEQLSYYAQNGYDSIPDEDKKYFLKCFGIFDKDPLTPKQFMMRVRVPGGHLTAEQAEAIANVAKKYGQDYIDITTRAQIELRYLDIENIPTLLQELQAVGIDSYQTGVDNFRNIVNDPLDKYAFDNLLPSQELLTKIQRIFLHDPEWIGALPRKFNTSISGSISNRCNVYGHDCCFVLAQKDGLYGYNMYLGGKVGEVAKSADIFLKNEEEVLKAYDSIIDLFKRFGFRDNRNKNRLHFLIQEAGMIELASAIRENAGINFATAGESLTTLDFTDADHGKVQLKDGSFALHAVVPSGIFSGSALFEAAQIAKEYGNSELRFSVEQNLYIMGVKDINTALKKHFFQEYKNVNTPYYNNLIACAGTKHCSFGVIENKEDAKNMAEYLSKKVPLEDARVRFYWSACVKGCGLHGLGDIGFEGCKAKLDGNTVDGVHISIGGKLVSEGLEGYTVIKSAPLIYAPYFIETLMLEYKNLRKERESFEKFHDRVLSSYSSAYIGFFMQLKAYLRSRNIELELKINKIAPTGKNEEFEIFELGRKLYYQLFKEEAYSSYERFSNENPREILPDLSNSNLDKKLLLLIETMIGNQTRATVFSELGEYISLSA